jgi:hypothetical protein
LPSAPFNSVGTKEWPSLRDGGSISRLNGWLVRTPVNASRSPLSTTMHDSEPVWVASPSPYETFIHNTLPAFTGALNGLNCLNEQRSLPSGLGVWMRVWRAAIAERSGKGSTLNLRSESGFRIYQVKYLSQDFFDPCGLHPPIKAV